MHEQNYQQAICSILARLSGRVFTDSQFGQLLRGLPQSQTGLSNRQLLRRGIFVYLITAWRSLSTGDRNTWITEAGTLPEGFNLYINRNINLILASQSPIQAFVSSVTVPVFDISIVQLTPEAFDIKNPSGSTVPSGYSLQIYSTYGRSPGQVFTAPADYQPTITFPAGSDFSSIQTIFSNWQALYGVLKLGSYICLSSFLVDNASGARGIESYACATSTEMPTTLQQAFDASQAVPDYPQINNDEDVSGSNLYILATSDSNNNELDYFLGSLGLEMYLADTAADLNSYFAFDDSGFRSMVANGAGTDYIDVQQTPDAFDLLAVTDADPSYSNVHITPLSLKLYARDDVNSQDLSIELGEDISEILIQAMDGTYTTAFEMSAGYTAFTLGSNIFKVSGLGNYANDAAAAAAGVPLDGLYHTAGVVKVRIV